MSSFWSHRLLICPIVCVVVLVYGLVDSSFGQRKFPPPPNTSGADEKSDNDRARPGAPIRQGGIRNRGNADGTRASKPKFINLLESKDLSQFRGYAQEEIGEGWSLDGKYLYFDGSGGGDVITRESYDDFDLQVEWKVADGANSGIMYRVSLGDSAPYMSGPEYQILDDAEHSDGKNELTSAGALYGMYPAKNKTLREVGTWNKTRITVDGNNITHYLNGKKVLEAEIGSDDWNQRLGDSKFKDWAKFGKNSEGHIAFQDHGNEVWFRNIRIKRLGSAVSTEEPVGRPDRAVPRRGGSKFDQIKPPTDDAGPPSRGGKRGQIGPPEDGPDQASRAVPKRGGSKFDQIKPPTDESNEKKDKKSEQKTEKKNGAPDK